MDSIIKDILSRFEVDGYKVDTIMKVKDFYIVNLSKNGEFLYDALYSYRNGKVSPYYPEKKDLDFMKEAAKNPIYDRRKKK